VKNVTAAMNTHATTEELLDALFSLRSVLIKGKYEISSFQNIWFYSKAMR
jgi:hypothetical protein